MFDLIPFFFLLFFQKVSSLPKKATNLVAIQIYFNPSFVTVVLISWMSRDTEGTHEKHTSYIKKINVQLKKLKKTFKNSQFLRF